MVPAGIVITVFMNATINRQAISGEQMRSISKEKTAGKDLLPVNVYFPILYRPVSRCVKQFPRRAAARLLERRLDPRIFSSPWLSGQ